MYKSDMMSYRPDFWINTMLRKYVSKGKDDLILYLKVSVEYQCTTQVYLHINVSINNKVKS